MDEHTLRLLEFEKIRLELMELCMSPQGADAVRRKGFETDAGLIGRDIARCLAARAALESGVPMPGTEFPDICALLPILGKEGLQLEGEELAAIGVHVLNALKLKRFVLKASRDEGLRGMAQAVPDLADVSRKIFHAVDAKGELKEKRIPALAAIRDRIRRFKEDVERTARQLLEADSSRSYWQSTVPTQRDGRTVLPLRVQHKGKVKGIVHELSASGSTVFIEPLEIVEKNNAIVQEENLYRQEVRRILRDLSAHVAGRSAELSLMRESVGAMDELFCRARYAILHGCRAAEPGGSELVLLDARHPLLGASCVPISVSVGDDYRILIVTGPNTGGKTVSLKTVGVLALMNQFGMEIPAREGSLLPVFDGVYADIGDEQSIEQSLSTFSAHVTNIAGIVQRATARSLVLMDELGAGTDPEEGVALAMALLDLFHEKGSLVLATTHHGILKNYGYTRSGVQNASMGFDKETLSPTFKILMGVPGESHALEIARRRGIPRTVVDAADAYLSDERTEISHLVKNLSDRHRKLAEAEEEQRTRESDLREKSRRTDLKELALKQKELELRRLGLKELRDFLSSMRREWEEIREKAGSVSSSAAEGSRELFEKLRERIEAEEGRIAEAREALEKDAGFEVREGMQVTIRGSGRRGTVLRRDRGRRWIVETETMRLSLLPSEMSPAGGEETGQTGYSVSYAGAESTDLPALEIDLRGLRLDEAVRRLERQIDAALVHGLKRFGVIHGKGDGILQKGIHEYLRNATMVEEYRFSPLDEGGYGKTIVVLKD